MANSFFQFKQFTVHHDRCAMKVTTDACLFGAWVAGELEKEKGKIKNALDIGTGTGLLSLMVSQKHQLYIDAIEIDEAAASQAAENILASGFQDITVVQQNILHLAARSYDCIFSNPPFYEADLASPDAKRDAAHHSSGLRWEELFAIISDRLTPAGVFYLLLPYKRKTELETLLKKNGLYASKLLSVNATAAHAPTRLLLAGSFREEFQSVYELSIKDATGNYTPDFTALLKEYYLYL